MAGLIDYLFGAASFMPHGYCLLWRPDLVAMHAVADVITAGSYFSIPAAIYVFVRRRPDIHYRWLVWLFILFITACGMTHGIGFLTLWVPAYGLEGLVKLVTAAVSITTAALMWPLLPAVAALPSPAQLRESNDRLQGEIVQRRQAEDELLKAQQGLEYRVDERTRQLRDANAELVELNVEHRRARLRLQSILHNTVDALITIDEAGLVEDYNPACERIFGYPADEVIGRNVSMLMNPTDGAQHDGYLSQYLATGKATIIGTGREVEGRRKDGTPVPLDLSVSKIDLGSSRLYSGILRDSSERKSAEAAMQALIDELQLSNAELARSNRELDDFAYIASHDLKEPLRAIQNHAAFILEDYQGRFDAEGDRRLQRLLQLSRRMEKLIADLLYFSRLGRGELATATLDPNALIADIEADLADMLAARNARLSIASTLPPVVGNQAQLKALLYNLILNGTKYNDAEEKLIEIGCLPGCEDEAASSQNVFYVRDNGIGIDETFKDEVFRIFKRLNSEKAYGEGTGAGLTFVKKIVENHGGRIWLESKRGIGTTFFFTLAGEP